MTIIYDYRAHLPGAERAAPDGGIGLRGAGGANPSGSGHDGPRPMQTDEYGMVVGSGEAQRNSEEQLPRVVVIDGSPAATALYRKSCESLGVDLRTFASARSALAWLGENGAELVFLDVLMPDVDGLSTLGKLRDLARHNDTVVVMVTSKDYAQDRQVARTLGAKDYLVKPVRSQDIRALIVQHTGAQPAGSREAAANR